MHGNKAASRTKTPQHDSHPDNGRNALNEREDRKRRKYNLVFYGFPELEKENPKERVEEDRNGVSKALEKIQLQIKSLFNPRS